MNGFYIALGPQGCGKSLFITKHTVDNYFPQKSVITENSTHRLVFSNYSLYGLEYQPISFDISKERQIIKIINGKEVPIIDILKKLEEDENYFDNSIMLLDEIHIYFDSRDFMANNKRQVQTFFSQLRKRNILLLATTQYILNLDVRIRRQCKMVFEMSQVKEHIFKSRFYSIDGYYTEYIREELFNLSEYYKYYDTLEIIH